jgi:pyrroloquinoline quinone (PQQ) biosynthesis protein C
MSLAFRNAAEYRSVSVKQYRNLIEEFPDKIKAIAAEHRPSRMPFFRNFTQLPESVATSPDVLGRIYLVYQSAMHATRAAVYFLPHLDSPALRKRKLQIFIDDDGLPGGDTHHYQLTRAFRNIGAVLPIADEDFGDPDDLCRRIDPTTAHFVRAAKALYSRSLGPWCSVEVMSDDWMRALADALSVYHPQIRNEPYFAECFAGHVEERHAEESLDMTQMVLKERPELLEDTLYHAKMMAESLDRIWHQLDNIIATTRGV